jgi:ribose transport system permease protein
VVIGGTSMLGGSGGVIGTIFGVAVLALHHVLLPRHRRGLARRLPVQPLLQPMFEGLILLIAVSLGGSAGVPDEEPSQHVRVKPWP